MLSLKDAAKRVGYSPSGLRKIVNRTKAGKPGPQIQFFQVPRGRIKFRLEWLDDFVLANSVEPGEVQPFRKPVNGRRTLGGARIELNQDWSTVA